MSENEFAGYLYTDRILEEQEAEAKAIAREKELDARARQRERERQEAMQRPHKEGAAAAGEQCAHDYALQSTHYERSPYTYGYCVKYTRLDIFFCRHCLDQQEKARTATVDRDEPAPPWFIH